MHKMAANKIQPNTDPLARMQRFVQQQQKHTVPIECSSTESFIIYTYVLINQHTKSSLYVYLIW